MTLKTLLQHHNLKASVSFCLMANESTVKSANGYSSFFFWHFFLPPPFSLWGKELIAIISSSEIWNQFPYPVLEKCRCWYTFKSCLIRIKCLESICWKMGFPRIYSSKSMMQKIWHMFGILFLKLPLFIREKENIC